ncbi:hypothetical protein [Sphingobium yanoikuyae]|jgi:hypothetical protein|uniref:hypothetical protein n=1 Tax=Sphingobium TaxID=165695 RepID=UPI0028B07034|nr:hypothetical protein [Sphingobium yanoikuyae]
MNRKPLTWAKAALHALGQTVTYVWPFLNRRNISIVLGIASLFGLVAPDRATDLRNIILAPMGVEQSAGDLL